MFTRNIVLVVSLMGFLRGFHVSSCDYNCADEPVFTPSRLVVKINDPTSASCSVCQRDCNSTFFGLENSLGTKTENGTTILWRVDRMTEWNTNVQCYYNSVNGTQCCSILNVTVYQPPDNVSISFINHSGPMFEGQEYTLQCTVENVAPVENLIVTFYGGQTVLGQLQSNKTEKKPVTEIFTLNINSSKHDDGVQYWCEAKLELGPEGPQRPPVVMSQNITATVYYKPELEGSQDPEPITIAEGNPLQLNCSAVGNPRPSYTWTLLPDGLNLSNSSILTFKSVTAQDKGQYRCFVKNNLGNNTVNYSVIVQVDYLLYYITAALILAVLLVIGLVIIYVQYYKNNRMGQYNLLDVFRLHPRQSIV